MPPISPTDTPQPQPAHPTRRTRAHHNPFNSVCAHQNPQQVVSAVLAGRRTTALAGVVYCSGAQMREAMRDNVLEVADEQGEGLQELLRRNDSMVSIPPSFLPD